MVSSLYFDIYVNVLSVQNVRRQINLSSVNEVVSDSSDQTPDAQPSPLPTLRCVPVVKLHCDHIV